MRPYAASVCGLKLLVYAALSCEHVQDTPHEWKGYTADKSPLDELPDHEYTWKGPGAPDVNPLDQLNDKPHLV